MSRRVKNPISTIKEPQVEIPSVRFVKYIELQVKILR